MGYEVTTEVFQGPFELLLNLVNAQKLELYELCISKIVDQFLLEVENMEKLDLNTTTEFALIASTLIELKCRRLLPLSKDVDLDEEFNDWEERDLLLARLMEAETFSQASLVLQQLIDKSSKCHSRKIGPPEPFASLRPNILGGLDPYLLGQSFAQLLESLKVEQISTEHIHAISITVEQAIEKTIHTLKSHPRLSFDQIVYNLTRIELVVTFLAILELYKSGQVIFEQDSAFSQLHIIWKRD